MDSSDYSATPYTIHLDTVGPLSVYAQGDLSHGKDGVVFLTVHGAGSSFNTWLDFAGDETMGDIRKRALFLHVSLPGQNNGDTDLPSDFIFPSMEALGMNLVTVLDHFRIKQVVGLGDGAGANIIMRFAMNHPGRVVGVMAINTEGVESASYKEKLLVKFKTSKTSVELNAKNIAKYSDAYKNRSDILGRLASGIKVDVLLMTGAKSSFLGDMEAMHKEITPGLCSIIKVDQVSNPLIESQDKVAEALILFCQGQGLMPTINRRMSRTNSQGSEGTGRRLSMTDYDTPNIRRLSLSAAADTEDTANAV